METVKNLEVWEVLVSSTKRKYEPFYVLAKDFAEVNVKVEEFVNKQLKEEEKPFLIDSVVYIGVGI